MDQSAHLSSTQSLFPHRRRGTTVFLRGTAASTTGKPLFELVNVPFCLGSGFGELDGVYDGSGLGVSGRVIDGEGDGASEGLSVGNGLGVLEVGNGVGTSEVGEGVGG
ncbi:hypothetical protein Ae201684P_009883 [Aphanomyces euteiches]|nr:hypothetical protein Ae201684P_009883 [Aphanomyces euteiches]